mgnify:CR=1 FL=1
MRQLMKRSRWFAFLTAGLIVGTLAGVFLQSTPVMAADATWNGRSLVYQDNTYINITDENQLKSMGLDEKGYAYGMLDKSGGKEKMKVIYFPPGTDITTATSAEFIVYDFKKPRTYTRESSTTISTEAAGENPDVGSSDCGIASVGFYICPISTFLAKNMDWLYGKLNDSLETQPLNVTDNKSGLYLAWNIMLGFANAAFIIAFLVIIYSQVTSAGISNYGIKKMLPRLAIAAVLVNISYYICAFAIDLSNISGHALQDVFMQIRTTVLTTGHSSGGSIEVFTWENLTALILSGGAAAVGIRAFLVGEGGVLTSAIILLLPVLLGALLAVLMVVLVLAARHALIVILTIISPLAFVCYLLPGTEKWFEKWRKMFMTMLIFFPAFSLLFGGSQLAAAAILQNASTIIEVILGLAVQIIALPLTPFLFKLSGGILNRIAGIVNNPNKGLIDRTRNWSKDKSTEIANKRSLGNDNLKGRQFIRRAGRHMSHRQRRTKERQERLQQQADNIYGRSNLHKREDLHAKQAKRQAEVLAAQDENRYAEAVQGYAPSDIKQSLPDRALQRVSTRWANRQQQFMDEAEEITRTLALEGIRKSNAQRAQNKKLADNVLNNDEYQRIAGGNVYVDEHGNNLGMDAALATAVAASRGETAKSIEEAHQVINHYKFNAQEKQELAKGGTVYRGNRVFNRNTPYVLEAALEDQMKNGTVDEVAELISVMPPEFNGSLAAGLASSNVKGKAPFLGGKLIDDIVKGDIPNEDALLKYVAEWVEGGKFKSEDVSITDAQGVKLLQKALNSRHGSIVTAEKRAAFRKKIDEALTERELKRNVTEAARGQYQILKTML